MPDGAWAASVERLGLMESLAEECGTSAEALSRMSANTLHWPIGIGPTPWEASSAVYAALGEDISIEWEALPWPTLREAHGIVGGVCELLGAGRDARRALRKSAGVEGDCIACGEPAPWNARDLGWRWATCATGDAAWICPECGAGDVDYEDGFPPPRWP